MPKWADDRKLFPVRITYSTSNDKRFGRVVIPKPLLELWGFPPQVCFEIIDDEIHVWPEFSER